VIDEGDSITLAAIATGDIISFSWEGPPGLSCTDCAAPIVQPDTAVSYTVTVTNADGCTATATARVLVRVSRDLYAPTAISPDGDGNNDAFTIYSSEEGSLIEELRIFDRWGNAVFALQDAAAGDESVGWRGDHRGQQVNPGVFAYWARVVTPNGQSEEIEGDVAVLR